MPTDLDFQTLTPLALNLPETLLGWIFAAFWLVLIGIVVWVGRDLYRTVSGRQWGLTLAFSVVAFVFAIPRFELMGGTAFPIFGQLTNSVTYRPLGFVGVALAAWFLNPMLALIVGAAEGLGRALFGSHQVADIFHYAVVGWLVSLMVQQTIRRIDWDIWRVPPIAATVGQFIIAWPLVFFATFFLVPRGTSFLPGLDLALASARPQWVIALLEGLVSGVIVWLVQAIFSYRPTSGMSRPPLEQDIRYRQTLQFLLYTIISLILVGSIVSAVGYRSARALIQTQMAHEANQTSQAIPNFIGQRQNGLVQWGDDGRLHSQNGDDQLASLEELFRSAPLYRRLILSDGVGNVIVSYPADRVPTLSRTELTAINAAARLNGPGEALSTELDGHPVVLSLVAQTRPESGESLYLIGRIPDQILHQLVDGLAAGYEGGRGYLVDENRLILADTAGIEQPSFEAEFADNLIVIEAPNGVDGGFYIEPDPLTQQREIHYRTMPDDGHPWNVVAEVPMGIVLQQAYRLVAGVLLITLLSSIVFGAILSRQGNVLGNRLQNLLAAVKKLPDLEPGQVVIPAEITSHDDEIGELGVEFELMQRQLYAQRSKLDNQMRELNLLLEISGVVAETQMNIQGGMKDLLEQVVQDTKAIGGRAIITALGSSPANRIDIGTGAVADQMRRYDAHIQTELQGKQYLTLTGPEEIEKIDASLSGQGVPFQSAIAYPLKGPKGSLGTVWLAWPEANEFRGAGRNLIRSVAEQASVMVTNWYTMINLNKRYRELWAVLNATDDAVIVIDPNNRISMMNPAGERELGFENDQGYVDQVISKLNIQSELADILSGIDQSDRLSGITIDSGKTFDINVSTIRNQRGQIAGRVAVLRDISKMAEINELKSEFVRLASHDLKDPITIVNGFIQILQMDPTLSETQSGHIQRMQAAMNQMQKLVEDLLNITRLESGLELEMLPVSIGEIFTSVVYMFDSMAQEVGNQLEVEIPAGFPKVEANHTFVQQAVANLVSNAIKYAPGSGAILIRAEEEGEDVVVSVIDKGGGIPLEVQPRIFEKFFRFSRPGHKRGKAHGLGLSFVQLVAERHNGHISFKSVEGEGTTFYLTLPKEQQKVAEPTMGD